MVPLRGEIGRLRGGSVCDPHEARSVARQLESIRDDERDRLAVVEDLRVVQRPQRRARRRELILIAAIQPREARRIFVRENLQHALERERRWRRFA